VTDNPLFSSVPSKEGKNSFPSAQLKGGGPPGATSGTTKTDPYSPGAAYTGLLGALDHEVEVLAQIDFDRVTPVSVLLYSDPSVPTPAPLEIFLAEGLWWFDDVVGGVPAQGSFRFDAADVAEATSIILNPFPPVGYASFAEYIAKYGETGSIHLAWKRYIDGQWVDHHLTLAYSAFLNNPPCVEFGITVFSFTGTTPLSGASGNTPTNHAEYHPGYGPPFPDGNIDRPIISFQHGAQPKPNALAVARVAFGAGTSGNVSFDCDWAGGFVVHAKRIAISRVAQILNPKLPYVAAAVKLAVVLCPAGPHSPHAATLTYLPETVSPEGARLLAIPPLARRVSLLCLYASGDAPLALFQVAFMSLNDDAIHWIDALSVRSDIFGEGIDIPPGVVTLALSNRSEDVGVALGAVFHLSL